MLRCTGWQCSRPVSGGLLQHAIQFQFRTCLQHLRYKDNRDPAGTPAHVTRTQVAEPGALISQPQPRTGPMTTITRSLTPNQQTAPCLCTHKPQHSPPKFHPCSQQPNTPAGTNPTLQKQSLDGEGTPPPPSVSESPRAVLCWLACCCAMVHARFPFRCCPCNTVQAVTAQTAETCHR